MERSGAGRKAGRKSAALGPKERRGLMQMAVSLALFLLVFAGQETFPERAGAWREGLTAVLRQDTDLQRVFRYLGQSVAEEIPILESLGTAWTEVFGGTALHMTGPDQAVMMSLRMEARSAEEDTWIKPELSQPAEAEGATAEETSDPIQIAVQQGLGLGGSVTPVLGVLTSGFGMREHPIDGEVKMHEGVDIAADIGVDILAFADGTVDYIGEGQGYGMYLQLRHDNGVTTFYAHCSELCVQKGMTVKRGDVIAKVGDTGNTTGPHLHFEMKKDGEHIDPLPYIDRLLS